jgi:methyltransferase (TIGR00027 family)
MNNLPLAPGRAKIMKANTASRTAQYMALFRAIETGRPSHKRLFSDPYAAIFLDKKLNRVAKFSKLPIIGRLIPKIIQKRGPGALSSGIARTKYIDELLWQTILKGVKQVIILGAGFDTRPLRLDYLNSIPVIEIDHPDTARWKINRLKETLGDLPKNVSYFQIDFNKQSLEDLASEHNLNFDIPTTIIWEGVTNYLTQHAIDETFEFVKKFTTGSYLIFTYINRLVLDNPGLFIGTEKVLENLTKNEESWTFGFNPEELSSYLAEFHLTLLEDLGAGEYRKKYMPDREAVSKGYEFYRVAFVSRQE